MSVSYGSKPNNNVAAARPTAALMRPVTRTAFWLLLTAGLALVATSGAASVPPPRIVVAFANQPAAAPGPAGTTGSRYGGTGYGVGQSAQRQARSVAAAYALREVTSWPIQLLSMHCVVFEIANGRPVADVVAALSKDSRVVLAQPLQEFHTLTTERAAALEAWGAHVAGLIRAPASSNIVPLLRAGG